MHHTEGDKWLTKLTESISSKAMFDVSSMCSGF